MVTKRQEVKNGIDKQPHKTTEHHETTALNPNFI